jgi:plastocyanin
VQTKLLNAVAAVFAVVVLAVLASSAYGAFTGGTSAVAGSNTVESGAITVTMKDLAFRAGTRTIATGSTVTWKNGDGPTHTVTATDKSFGAQELAQGKSYAHTFASAGKHAYYCSIHPFMKGTITVVAPYGTG